MDKISFALARSKGLTLGLFRGVGFLHSALHKSEDFKPNRDSIELDWVACVVEEDFPWLLTLVSKLSGDAETSTYPFFSFSAINFSWDFWAWIGVSKVLIEVYNPRTFLDLSSHFIPAFYATVVFQIPANRR